jgi:ABC-type multidrug transport system ATPase subunit
MPDGENPKPILMTLRSSVNEHPSTSSRFSISIKNLSKRFNREWIFRNVTFEFFAGNTYAVTGPNGSGKSTFLQVLWGQVPQTSGELNFRKGDAHIPMDEWYKQVSIATPYMDLIDEFTLREMVDFHFRLKQIRPGVSRDDLIQIMYLEDATEKPLSNFSSGMKQRVKLGLAMYTDTQTFFLDEPGTNLDSRAFDWFVRQLAQVPVNSLIFIASNESKDYPHTATILSMPEFKK